MRNALRWGLIFLIPLIALTVMATPAELHAVVATAPHLPDALGPMSLVPALMGAVRFEVKAFTYDQLKRDANPATVNQPETIPWVWWDSQDITTNFGTVYFFASTSNDPTIANIQQANTLSADQYFRVFAVTADFLIGASGTSSTAPLIVDDLLGIQNTARTFFRFDMNQKQYANTPLTCLHSSGGIFVNLQLGTPTASGLTVAAQNWAPDGGWWVGGSWVLPPRQTFQSWLQGAAVTLNATRKTRISLHGALSRKVL